MNVLSKESYANQGIGINCRDGSQDDFERIKSFSDLTRGVDVNGGTLKYCTLPGPLHNW